MAEETPSASSRIFISGKDLEDGSLTFYARLTNAKGLNVDLLESTFNLRVKNDTTTLFATYGLLNRSDLAVAVPIQRVSVEASIKSQLVRFGPSSGIPGSQVPAFVASRSGSATGVGDVAVRAKYNVFNGERAAVAGGLRKGACRKGQRPISWPRSQVSRPCRERLRILASSRGFASTWLALSGPAERESLRAPRRWINSGELR
jgi:hypothetical protein